MSKLASNIGWRVTSMAFAIPLGIVARKLILSRVQAKDKKHTHPADPDTTWTQALVVAGITAATMAVVDVVSSRAAAAAWKKITGELPRQITSYTR